MNELLFRASTEVVVREDLEAKLKKGAKLRIKYGIDPTGDRIHLGHAATIRKLKHFQDAGHQVVLIVGSFTGQIGDASDKDSERTILTKEEVQANMANYETLLAKIFDIDSAEIHYNHEWFNDMSLDEWLRINQLFSLAQMIERDNFSKRFERGDRIGLQEMQYPMLQGYDSVAVRADVEIGGNDQLFNLLAGRNIQKAYDQEPQNIISYELLLADDGRKMSKSWANCIWIDDEPADMFGKVMSINDDLIMHYFKLVTEVSDDEMTKLEKDLKTNNPRDVKLRLAEEIVSIYHDETSAASAKEAWLSQFSDKKLPATIPDFVVDNQQQNLVDLIVAVELADNKSEAKRLIEQGGVRINSHKVDSEMVNVNDGDVLQVGKRKFVRIKTK
ncbi:MAG: tyrosine--tRNA ligase [Candidatus Saccharimonadales bacterium]